jgi:hypothetical protein
MKQSSLINFIENIRQAWGPLDSDLIAKSQSLLQELAKAPTSEPWLSELRGDLGNSRELYRDPKHGFILLAHTEKRGLYRAPHDHGNGWVIYAVQNGEMEMRTYGHIQDLRDEANIVRRETYRMKAGESRVYLPGDIHDTRCVSDSVLMLRLTSCDLDAEKQHGRMHKYAEQT